MKTYHIDSKNYLYQLGVNSHLGKIIIQGRLETVFDARNHVVNTIERIDKETIKMRKYTFENMKGLDDFLEQDLAMNSPMFQRLRTRLMRENPSLIIGEF